jgi:Flp pilus assembly protein TadG
MRLRGVSRWDADERGSAAIELALVAPVLAILAVASFGVWESGARSQDMRAALDVAAEYYMNGGTDDAVARALSREGWRNKPPNGDVTTARDFRCGESDAQENAVCPGGRTPAAYVTLTASASTNQALVRPGITLQRVIRVR